MKTKIKKLMLTIVLVLSAVALSPAQTNYSITKRVPEGSNPQVSITELAVNHLPYNGRDKVYTRILAKNGIEFAITFPDRYQNLTIERMNTNIVIDGRKILVKEPGSLAFKYSYTENGESHDCGVLGDVNYYGKLSYNGKTDLQANPIEVKATNENDKLVVPNVFPAKGWGFATPGLDPENLTLEMLEKFEATIFSESSQMALKDLLQIGREKGYFVNGKVKIVVAFGDTSSNALPNGVPGASSLQIITLVDARTYNLNLSQEGQGTVSASKSQLKPRESATLTAQAAQGWRFDHWEENAQNLGTTNPLTVTMGAQDRSIKAVFTEIPKVRVTLQILDTKGQKLANPQSQEVTSGGTVTFQVPNLANVNFKGWKRNGQIVETGNTYTLSNVTQNETIQAVFEIPVQSISLSFTELNLKVGESKALPNVTVIPSNATDQTITWLSNDPGIAKIENGKVVGVSAGVVNLVASSSNQKKATLKVVVQAVKHTVTVELVAEGTSQSLGTKNYEVEQGKTVTLKATELGAEAKYEFVKWDRNGTVSSEQSISFVVNSSETLKAIFKEKVVQPQESDFPPYTANLQTFKVNQTVDASKVVWEDFPQGVDKSTIKYSLRDVNGVDISNNKQIFEVNGQNLTFKKIGTYFLIATLRDNQNNEIRIDLTIQVNE